MVFVLTRVYGALESGYKKTGYKNMPVIITFSLETFLYFAELILPFIGTYRL